MRSCRTFCCGTPGSIRSTTISGFRHRTLIQDSRAVPAEANGEPLSDRIRLGGPRLRNSRSKLSRVSSSLVAWFAVTPRS